MRYTYKEKSSTLNHTQSFAHVLAQTEPQGGRHRVNRCVFSPPDKHADSVLGEVMVFAPRCAFDARWRAFGAQKYWPLGHKNTR